MRKRVNFYIDRALLDGLKRIKERDGVPESEQVRRGIQMWLDAKLKEGGIRKTRKRS